jgi:hypothetical protein
MEEVDQRDVLCIRDIEAIALVLVEAIENNLGRKPEQASADSGYCSEPNLKARSEHVVSTAMSHLDAPSTRPRQTEKLVDR